MPSIDCLAIPTYSYVEYIICVQSYDYSYRYCAFLCKKLGCVDKKFGDRHQTFYVCPSKSSRYNDLLTLHKSKYTKV